MGVYIMRFIALFDQGEPLIPVVLEQSEDGVYVRVDGRVIVHCVTGTNEIVVSKAGAAEKGLNLILED